MLRDTAGYQRRMNDYSTGWTGSYLFRGKVSGSKGDKTKRPPKECSAELCRGDGRRGSQPAFHLIVIDQASLLRHWSTPIQNHKVGYALHFETRCQLGIAFCVNLDYDGAPSHIGGCAGNLWRGHPAGTAPRRPEIHQDRRAGVLGDFVELFGIDFKWFIDGRQRILTLTATSGFGQMFGRDTVFLRAYLAGSNKRHVDVLLRRENCPGVLGPTQQMRFYKPRPSCVTTTKVIWSRLRRRFTPVRSRCPIFSLPFRSVVASARSTTIATSNFE